jgi:hypothetical protein
MGVLPGIDVLPLLSKQTCSDSVTKVHTAHRIQKFQKK